MGNLDYNMDFVTENIDWVGNNRIWDSNMNEVTIDQVNTEEEYVIF